MHNICPYKVWSAPRLKWSIVTRAHVPRQVGGARGRAMRYSGAQWVQRLKPGDEGHAYYASAVRALPGV
jgi:hypothetical protein